MESFTTFSFTCSKHGSRDETQCYVYGTSVRCKECLKERNHARYLTNKSTILEKVKTYQAEHPELAKNRRKVHKDQIRKQQRAWYEKNSERVKARARNWVRDNNSHAKQVRKQYRNAHIDELRAKHVIYRQYKPDFIRKIARVHAKCVKSAALYFYSNGMMQCALCEESQFKNLCLDHIEGGGTQHRLKDPGTRGKAVYAWCKRNEYPPIFRVLCWNCNFLVIPRAEPTNSKQIKCMRRLKEEVLSHYAGGKPICSECGNQDIRVLTIDHVNKGGRKHLTGLKIKGGTQFYRWLRSNGFPTGYRVLCFNCNCGPSS